MSVCVAEQTQLTVDKTIPAQAAQDDSRIEAIVWKMISLEEEVEKLKKENAKL